MTGSAVNLFREVHPAGLPSSAWSAFWNPRRVARGWREKCWWAYPVARILFTRLSYRWYPGYQQVLYDSW